MTGLLDLLVLVGKLTLVVVATLEAIALMNEVFRWLNGSRYHRAPLWRIGVRVLYLTVFVSLLAWWCWR